MEWIVLAVVAGGAWWWWNKRKGPGGPKGKGPKAGGSGGSDLK
jgi:hypothetical protein